MAVLFGVYSVMSRIFWVLLQGSIGLALPVVTRWGSVNRMMHSLVANEAALKVAVSYAEFPGNPSSRVIAAERVRGQDIKKCIEIRNPGR